MATVKDVAERAGVSVATVSRTLSGYPHVSATAREQVLRAVKELNYRPDPVARSLRRRRSELIGLVVSTVENVFFTEVARAAEQAAHERGYHLILCNTDENPAHEATYLKILDDQLVAGVILAPAPGDARHLEPYLDNGWPILLINRRLDHLPCTSITSNDEEAAFRCTQRLIQSGRRRIAAVTGLPDVFTTHQRLAGYHRALREANLAPDPALEVSGWASIQGGYQATIDLMQGADRPDGIFAFNNLLTQGVVTALQELAITWPDQIEIAGFGAFTTAHLYHPPLTLVRQPTHEMGRKAVELLLERIENDEHDPTPRQIVLSNQVVSGPLPFGSLDSLPSS